MPEKKKATSAKRHSKLLARIQRDNENDARLGIIEELFDDFYLHRRRVYWLNFVRGLFFGFGSILGGTLLVAIVIWILSQFVHWPGVGDFFEQLTDTLSNAKR